MNAPSKKISTKYFQKGTRQDSRTSDTFYKIPAMQFNCIWKNKIKLQKIGGFKNSVKNINNLFSNNPSLIAMIYMYDLKKKMSIIKTNNNFILILLRYIYI